MKDLFDSMYFLLDKRMTRAPVASREQIQSAMQTLKGDAADRLRELTLQQQMHQRNQLMQQQGMNFLINILLQAQFCIKIYTSRGLTLVNCCPFIINLLIFYWELQNTWREIYCSNCTLIFTKVQFFDL